MKCVQKSEILVRYSIQFYIYIYMSLDNNINIVLVIIYIIVIFNMMCKSCREKNIYTFSYFCVSLTM